MTARSASITWPGPTGMPAARRMRANCMMLSTSLPFTGRSAERLLGELGAHGIEQLHGFGALQAGDVVLVFEQHAQGRVDDRGIERHRVELEQRFRPVDRLGDARQLEEIELAQLVDEADDLA